MSRPHLDWWLILPFILVSSLGMLVLRSIVPELVGVQALFLAVAFVAFLFFSSLDYQFLFSLHFPVYILSLLFLLTPMLFGAVSRGAVRWIQVWEFSLQPSELIKPFLLITFAVIAASRQNHKLLKLIILGGIPTLLVFIQPDLGTTLVIGVAWAAIVLSQIPLRQVIPLAATLVLLVPFSYKFILHDYQRQRLTTFVNPYQDPLGQGYHVIQSIIAVGSGQFSGRGLGHGTQSQLRFLPERHTDFIFASLSEELGYAGSFFVLWLLVVLYWRIYKISQIVRDPASSLFCLAVASMLTFQTFVNMGMNMGIAPVTGITLPLLSYGGSSFLTVGILLGIVNSISRNHKTDTYFEIH